VTKSRLSIAIVGAGPGGLTAASTLRLFGLDVQVYEQAAGFARCLADAGGDTRGAWLYGDDAWNDALVYA
jgi:2-polyprenyl-6-methoxyphenol hydroxylase-like FAD-dependent oxidoreductase